jgi:hypothetical protein
MKLSPYVRHELSSVVSANVINRQSIKTYGATTFRRMTLN